MAASDHSTNHNDKVLLTSRLEMCLDFANTLAYRGSTPAESLHNFADLMKWCSGASVIPPALEQQLRGWSEKHPKRVADIFSNAIAMRELIYRIFHALASGANPEDADVDHLNRELRDAPARSAIRRSGERFGWEVEELKHSANAILAPLLWSAGDLLVAPQLARLRECSNDKCLWLFLDDSKNGTRRWCSMQSCGNRAKAHRHYLRQKGA